MKERRSVVQRRLILWTVSIPVLFFLVASLLRPGTRSMVSSTLAGQQIHLQKIQPAQLKQEAAWQAAMVPTHEYCKQVLDSAGQITTLPANSKMQDIRVQNVAHPIHMCLIASNDIVSGALMGGGWEHGITAFVLGHLQQSQRAKPLFVDIGANVGTHAVKVAAAGFRTVAIEAAPTNQALLRTTYCANQQALSNFVLIGTALGGKTQDCSIWAPSINTGNGMMFCGDQQPAADMVRLGDASTQRLDELITEEIEVIKMDVEGYEAHVMSGATNLLAAGKIRWLTFEFTPAAILKKGGDPWGFVANLIAAGFDCAKSPNDANTGRFLTPSAFLQLAQHANTWPAVQMDMFCKRTRTPFDQVPA